MPSSGAVSRCLRAALPILALLAAPAAPVSSARPFDLYVDATEAPRGIFHSREVIPAAPGPLTLAYPKWIQGEHSPTGPIMQVAGLTVSAGGTPLPWRRDPLDVFLVRVEVPAGAREVEVTLDYLSPPETFGLDGYGETPNATAHVLIVDWHDLLVYPPGPTALDVPVRATLRLPAGWKYDTALAVAGANGAPGTLAKGGSLALAPTTLLTLNDS